MWATAVGRSEDGPGYFKGLNLEIEIIDSLKRNLPLEGWALNRALRLSFIDSSIEHYTDAFVKKTEESQGIETDLHDYSITRRINNHLHRPKRDSLTTICPYIFKDAEGNNFQLGAASDQLAALLIGSYIHGRSEHARFRGRDWRRHEVKNNIVLPELLTLEPWKSFSKGNLVSKIPSIGELLYSVVMP